MRIYLIFTFILYIGLYNNDMLKKTNEIEKFDKNFNFAQKNNPWKVIMIKDRVIYFQNGENLKTYLFDLEYIGQLQKDGDKAPYLILSGRSCNNCDENISIYIHSPSEGNMKSNGRQKKYLYPGKILDFLTDEVVFESRMFYGNCNIKFTNSVFWIQKFLNNQSQWEKKIFVVQVQNDTLKEFNIYDKELFLKIDKEKKCFEIEGIVRTTEP